MLVATITETKNRLSALLDRVKAGESVLIVDRGIPVARLESVISAASDPDGRIARLERAGAINVARQPPAAELLASPPPSPRRETGAVEALIAERRGGR